MPKVNGKGSFYKVFYEIILSLGMTELKAQVAWKENVSNFHMFKSTDFGFNLCVVFREMRNGEFLKEIILLICPNSYICSTAAKIVYDPDATNDDP